MMQNLTWWKIKVGFGLFLIAYITWASLYGGHTVLIPVLYELALAVIIFGVAIHLYHYCILKKNNPQLQHPDQLITQGGFFSLIRHPMYLGDVIFYGGLMMIHADLPALALFAAGSFAVMRQVEVEEKELARQFEKEYTAWEEKTARILPLLY